MIRFGVVPVAAAQISSRSQLRKQKAIKVKTDKKDLFKVIFIILKSITDAPKVQHFPRGGFGGTYRQTGW